MPTPTPMRVESAHALCGSSMRVAAAASRMLASHTTARLQMTGQCGPAEGVSRCLGTATFRSWLSGQCYATVAQATSRLLIPGRPTAPAAAPGLIREYEIRLSDPR